MGCVLFYLFVQFVQFKFVQFTSICFTPEFSKLFSVSLETCGCLIEVDDVLLLLILGAPTLLSRR